MKARYGNKEACDMGFISNSVGKKLSCIKSLKIGCSANRQLMSSPGYAKTNQYAQHAARESFRKC